VPATAISPTFRQPFVIIILDITPLPLSTFASITLPSAYVSLLAFKSANSLCKTMDSSNLSKFIPVSAEISIH
jgi:hypothetical protein